MILIIFFGFGMIGFGCLMAVKPIQFSHGIVRFSEQPWFHTFEIISRLIAGLVFLLLADETAYPKIVLFIGGILCFTGMFLFLIGAERHKRFARLTSDIGQNFRPIGFVAILCGLGIVHLAGF